MARFTKVHRAKTNEYGSTAAIAALVFDIIRPMLLAACNAVVFRMRGAFWTHQRLLIEIVHVHAFALAALFAANEIRVLALEALVIG